MMQWYLCIAAPLAYVGVGVLFTAIMKKIEGEKAATEDDIGIIAFWPIVLLMLALIGPFRLGMFLLEKIMGD